MNQSKMDSLVFVVQPNVLSLDSIAPIHWQSSANLSLDLNAIIWLNWRTWWKWFHFSSIDVDSRRRLDIFEPRVVSELCALCCSNCGSIKWNFKIHDRWWWNAASEFRSNCTANDNGKKAKHFRLMQAWHYSSCTFMKNALTEADQKRVMNKWLKMSSALTGRQTGE